MTDKILTIGGYGYSKQEFFDHLVSNGVDVLVDIRQRRGMRGQRYSFLNSTALQNELAAKHIAYRHLKELAPTSEIRAAQKEVDVSSGHGKADRLRLSSGFTEMYWRQVLSQYEASDVMRGLSVFERPCLFCVEAPPSACHRSLVSSWLARELGLSVLDIRRSSKS